MKPDTQAVRKSAAERWREREGIAEPVVSPLAAARRASRAASDSERAEAEAAAAAHRATDPAELAKVILQRRGRVVYRASVAGGPDGLWFVSGERTRIDDAALIALAAKIQGSGVLPDTREEAMKAMNDAEATRFADRGTSKSRVLNDLALVVSAAGTARLAATRMGGGVSMQMLHNAKGCHAPINDAVLSALYGKSGCTLRGHLTKPDPFAADRPAAPALADAAREAAQVESDHPGDEIPADQPEGDCTDIGAVLERRRDERATIPPGTSESTGEEPGTPAAARPKVENREVPGGDNVAGHSMDRQVAMAPGETDAAPMAPIPAAIAALDGVRFRIIEAAARARIAIEEATAITVKAEADLAALDRAAAILSGVAA